MTTLCTTISKNTGIIFNVRHNLNKNTVLLLYRSLIQPYIDYCTIIWATLRVITLKGCFENKKKALRAITLTKRNEYATPLFKNLNILTVYDINTLQTLCFVYKVVNNLLLKHFII